MVWCPSYPLDRNRCDQVVAAGSGAGFRVCFVLLAGAAKSTFFTLLAGRPAKSTLTSYFWPVLYAWPLGLDGRASIARRSAHNPASLSLSEFSLLEAADCHRYSGRNARPQHRRMLPSRPRAMRSARSAAAISSRSLCANSAFARNRATHALHLRLSLSAF
jgi:hypothetical protein